MKVQVRFISVLGMLFKGGLKMVRQRFLISKYIKELSRSNYSQLDDKYEQLYVSKNGLMELYRLKE